MEKELEIIDKYHSTSNKFVRDKIIMNLYNEFHDKSIAFARSKLNKLFFISLTPQDFEYLVFIAIKKTLEKRDAVQQFSLIQVYLQSYKFLVLDYIKKFLTYKHKTTNISKNIDFIDDRNIVEQQKPILKYIEEELQIKFLFSEKVGLSEIEKQILSLKLSGYKNSVISESLNLSIKSVNSSFQRIKRISKSFLNDEYNNQDCNY